MDDKNHAQCGTICISILLSDKEAHVAHSPVMPICLEPYDKFFNHIQYTYQLT